MIVAWQNFKGFSYSRQDTPIPILFNKLVNKTKKILLYLKLFVFSLATLSWDPDITLHFYTNNSWMLERLINTESEKQFRFNYICNVYAVNLFLIKLYFQFIKCDIVIVTRKKVYKIWIRAAKVFDLSLQKYFLCTNREFFGPYIRFFFSHCIVFRSKPVSNVDE